MIFVTVTRVHDICCHAMRIVLKDDLAVVVVVVVVVWRNQCKEPSIWGKHTVGLLVDLSAVGV
jgi:hypothetical protein